MYAGYQQIPFSEPVLSVLMAITAHFAVNPFNYPINSANISNY